MRVGRSIDFKGVGRAVCAALAAVAGALMAVPAALAEEPVDWQLGFQAAATPVRERIDGLHDQLLVIITVIALFVLGLLLYVIVKFSAKRHPMPTQTTHNTLLEVIWFAVPCLILLYIAIPSFKLLYYVDRTQKADMTLKVTGHQWYWSYEYPDQGLTEAAGLDITSNMLVPEDQPVKTGQKRLLDVDNPVVVPVGATIRVLVVGTEPAIHSWFVPAAGVQEYAVVGRTNESWMKIDRAGTFYGQCNQICGLRHPFMPIAIQAVPKDEFDKWVAAKKGPTQKKADAETPGAIHLAADAARQSGGQ
jgi:cytochrome c oxidase subunit II